jgi:hypothetical protein
MMWIIILIAIAVFLFFVFRKGDSKIISKSENYKSVENFKEYSTVNKTHENDIVNGYKATEEEKKSIFNKYYEEFKNFDISTLNHFIESGKKSSYEEYTDDDKMKFKAQRTLIEEKRKVEELRRIQNQLQTVKINQNLVESINENYNNVNEIDKIVRSINFNLLYSTEKTKIDNLLELKGSMTTKQFYEIVFRGNYCNDIEEVSFNYKCLPDGMFEIERKYKENGSEYNSIWTGNLISKQDIDFNFAYKKENLDLNEAIKLYSNIIESESTPMITYIKTAERISIILGKQKMYETDYYLLSNIYNVISESCKNTDFGFFNPAIISTRLEKAEKKLDK